MLVTKHCCFGCATAGKNKVWGSSAHQAWALGLQARILQAAVIALSAVCAVAVTLDSP